MITDIDCKKLHLIPCANPGMSCCDFIVFTKAWADNVQRRETWCSRWRRNCMKDGYIQACDPDFKIKGE